MPKEIDGCFYRVMVGPFVPPHPDNVPIDGDRSISVFQFHNGKVDLKTRYIDTERLKLERKANKAMFGLYRNAERLVAPGWKPNEVRSYDWNICMLIRTAAAWEGADSHIFVESSRVHGNAFPFFPPNGEAPPQGNIETKPDHVRWDIDPTKKDRSSLPDPKGILDCPSEFRRIDERFVSHQYDYVWLNVFMPNNSDG